MSKTKLLTVVVPVYNMESYLSRCLDSLLQDKILGNLEIIAVNDGSTDGSLALLKEYEKRFPDVVRVIDKENGGHGSGVNVGLAEACGKYFRVVDSDDFVCRDAFSAFVERLEFEDSDLVITDYRRIYTQDDKSVLVSYSGLEDSRQYSFESLRLSDLNGEFFVMAGSTYKTEILRKSNLLLFEKTYYVDMQFNIQPIAYVKTLVYYKLDIYRYMLGRENQSVAYKSLVLHRDDHEKVIRWAVSAYSNLEKTATESVLSYLLLVMNFFLKTHYIVFSLLSKSSFNTYSRIKAFDNFLLLESHRLYEESNFNKLIFLQRKTNFFFSRVGGHFAFRLFSLLKRLKAKAAKRSADNS
ncbi:MAG: glycosyltransferase family 2 protein [Ruminococcaceae bacterium]|nr:glycosyltransferase family 2 protein [Oscillospiraceae bacterium]